MKQLATALLIFAAVAIYLAAGVVDLFERPA